MSVKQSTFLSRFTALSLRTYLIGLIGLATIVRLIGITKSNIWHDEGFTMMLIQRGPGEIWARTARDVHPPFYYELLHFWTGLFGRSELAARGLSLAAGVGTVVLAYFTMRRLFKNEGVARLAGLFVAMAPYLIRYSQEARMYALLGFLALLATWLLIKALDSNRWLTWLGYGVVLGLALLTHYYAILLIPIHIGYSWARSGSPLKLLKNPRWWSAYLLGALVFVPWLPHFWSQFTRGQGVGWISKPDLSTLPNSILQMLTYSNLPGVAIWPKIAIAAVFIIGIPVAILTRPRQRFNLLFLTSYAAVPPLLIFLVSFKKPLYVDRYFVFSMVAYYMLLAVVVAGGKLRQHTRLLTATIVGLLLIFTGGIVSVYIQDNHQMKTIAAAVNAGYEPGDVILSGTLYTYFDFTYYNKTGQAMVIYQKNKPNGYGESSLFYDRLSQVTVPSLGAVQPASGRVWVVGKTGKHDYYDQVPANWHQIGQAITANDNQVRLYQVDRALATPVQ